MTFQIRSEVVMGRKADVRELMEKLHAAHKTYMQSWNEYQAQGVDQPEPKEVSSRRERMESALRQLFDGHLNSLDERFQSGEPQATNEVIDFLAIDIPALKCGRLKEKWLHRLKSTSLTIDQQQRLFHLAISMCISPDYRREMTQWNRLMAKLADQPFTLGLFQLTEDPNPIVCSKAKRMLFVILNSRKNLIQPRELQSIWLSQVSN